MKRKSVHLKATLSIALLLCGTATRIVSAADSEAAAFTEKKLSPEWVKSLTERGTPTVYTGKDLQYIGMPVGGLCAGELYLGGDGKLWKWDIFNNITDEGEYYVNPQNSDVVTKQGYPVDQGFSVRITEAGKSQIRSLDKKGFESVSFCGEYPIGTVEYRDKATPLAVTLEAFSPFIPLNVEDSSLPVTVMRFTLKNDGKQPLEVELGGWLENAVCNTASKGEEGKRVNRILREPKALIVESSAAAPTLNAGGDRGDVVFDDFNKETYDGWSVEGNAFGTGPIPRTKMPAYQGDVGGVGDRVVNSHATATGTEGTKDDATGSLTSKPFVINRNYIRFWIGGGHRPGQLGFQLLVDGKQVRSAVGKDNNRMELDTFDVRELQGKTAQLRIFDNAMGGWGNIGVGRISFVDQSNSKPLKDRADFGTMALSLLEPTSEDVAIASVAASPVEGIFGVNGGSEKPFSQKLIGGLSRKVSLAPGASKTVTFAISWNFPNLHLDGIKTPQGQYYATRYNSASAVTRYLAANFDRLAGQTRLWHDTWYKDSTLPYWLLDRALANITVLASSTVHRFGDGRFYGWEGVGSCAGTCTHVWQYEQAMGRLFPDLDILLRERAEFKPGIGFEADGMIQHRGEFGCGQAIDGQAGTILRAYRDYQASPDDAFLKRNWPAIKKAIGWFFTQPGGTEGVLTGGQHNTLDSSWYGPVSWLNGLYLASLRAGEEMAKVMGDTEFASQCRQIFEKGSKAMVADLFNGEYFINKPDPQHPEAVNSGNGCEINQVMGQSWAYQVGLGRILPEKETRSALEAIWHYNFIPDVGPFREVNKPGRWYAVAGEAGLVVATFPKPDWDFEKAKGKGADSGYAGYFNECQSGYEYEVAGHMIWAGMVGQGLAVERAIHDRYNGAKRNPWNEIECGSHYARSMASYGAFTAVCGYEYNGPQGYIAFAPRLTPDKFEAAFTAAQGWGSFSQEKKDAALQASLLVRWGSLRLKTFGLAQTAGIAGKTVQASVDGKPVEATLSLAGNQWRVEFKNDLTLKTNQRLTVNVR
jgi:uncharacterized protein (DUF608 family)